MAIKIIFYISTDAPILIVIRLCLSVEKWLDFEAASVRMGGG